MIFDTFEQYMNNHGLPLYPNGIPDTFASLNTETDPTQMMNPLSNMESIVLSVAGVAVAAGALILGRRWWKDRDTQNSIKKAVKARFSNEGKKNNPGNGPSNRHDEESKNNYESMNNNSSQNQSGFSGQAKLIGKAASIFSSKKN